MPLRDRPHWPAVTGAVEADTSVQSQRFFYLLNGTNQALTRENAGTDIQTITATRH